MQLEGENAIVTGSATGIGEASAVLMAREGARVVVADYNEDQGRETVRTIEGEGGEALFVETDVSRERDVKQCVRAARDEYGTPDILHNNAGVNPVEGSVLEADVEDFRTIMDTNLKGYFLFSKFTIPHMVENGGGVIVNTASVMGLNLRGYEENALYAASKGGIVTLTKCMALDHEEDGIRVNGIAPGLINTPLGENWISQQENPEDLREGAGDPRDVARAVLYLVSDDARWVNGTVLTVDGGETLS